MPLEAVPTLVKMALAHKMQATKAVAAPTRSARMVPAPLSVRLPARARNAVVARAVEDDPSAKLQEQANQAAKWVQEKWEATSDSEKPAAVGIIVAAVVAQIVIGSAVDAVDRLPFIQQFLEFVGLAVTAVYGYRYVTDPAERDNVKKTWDSFVAAVTGSK